MPREVQTSVFPGDYGQRITARRFAGLGYSHTRAFMAMHDTAYRAEGSAGFLADYGDVVEEAVILGRQPQSWLTRVDELNAFERGLALSLRGAYGELEAELIAAEVAQRTARKLFTEVGETITIDSPFSTT